MIFPVIRLLDKEAINRFRRKRRLAVGGQETELLTPIMVLFRILLLKQAFRFRQDVIDPVLSPNRSILFNCRHPKRGFDFIPFCRSKNSTNISPSIEGIRDLTTIVSHQIVHLVHSLFERSPSVLSAAIACMASKNFFRLCSTGGNGFIDQPSSTKHDRPGFINNGHSNIINFTGSKPFTIQNQLITAKNGVVEHLHFRISPLFTVRNQFSRMIRRICRRIEKPLFTAFNCNQKRIMKGVFFNLFDRCRFHDLHIFHCFVPSFFYFFSLGGFLFVPLSVFISYHTISDLSILFFNFFLFFFIFFCGGYLLGITIFCQSPPTQPPIFPLQNYFQNKKRKTIPSKTIFKTKNENHSLQKIKKTKAITPSSFLTFLLKYLFYLHLFLHIDLY